jgi:hypothetical protein
VYNDKQPNFTTAAVIAVIAAGLFTLFSQTACTPRHVEASQPLEIAYYHDPTIKLDQATRAKLAAEIIAGLRGSYRIVKVKMTEIGKVQKASDVFSTDFDFGKPIECAVNLPRELTGNAEAERQARAESQRRCAPEIERRRKLVEEQLQQMAALINRPGKGLTDCTSFNDFVTRLQRDKPSVALIVTDGRANCQEELLSYTPAHAGRIIVIQCPNPEGKTDEYNKLLRQMLPTAQILMMHQTAEAMHLLTQPETRLAAPTSLTPAQ